MQLGELGINGRVNYLDAVAGAKHSSFVLLTFVLILLILLLGKYEGHTPAISSAPSRNRARARAWVRVSLLQAWLQLAGSLLPEAAGTAVDVERLAVEVGVRHRPVVRVAPASAQPRGRGAVATGGLDEAVEGVAGDDVEDVAGVEEGLGADDDPGEAEDVRAGDVVAGVPGHHLAGGQGLAVDLDEAAGVDQLQHGAVLALHTPPERTQVVEARQASLMKQGSLPRRTRGKLDKIFLFFARKNFGDFTKAEKLQAYLSQYYFKHTRPKSLSRRQHIQLMISKTLRHIIIAETGKKNGASIVDPLPKLELSLSF